MKRMESGIRVITKTGKRGTVYHSKGMIAGRVQVYIDGEDIPILCVFKTLEVNGFIN